MFNWACPRCGRENSPAFTECPDCKERDLQAQAEAAEAPPAPFQSIPAEQPRYQTPPQTQEWQVPYQPPQPPPVYNAPPPQPQYAAQPPQQYAPQPPPQYLPQQPQPQYPPQQYAPQQPPYAPQYAPQAPQQPYNQTQPLYVQQPLQQQPQQYQPETQQAPPQYQPQQQAPAQYAARPTQQTYAPAPPAAAPAPPKPKPAFVPPSTPAAPAPPPPGFAAKLGALPVPILILLFAAVFLLIGAGIYYGYQRYGKGGAGFSGGEQATAANKPKATNPLQKYIEVVGIRLMTDAKKRPLAKFVIINHGSTVLDNLAGNVSLWASTSRSEEDAVGSFAFDIPSIAAGESKEVSAPFKTKLKMYELPDWQNTTPEIQITSPQP